MVKEMGKAVAVINGELEGLPALASVESASELLHENSRLGLLRLREILSQPLAADADLKEKRAIGNLALGVNKLIVRVAEAEFQKERGDRLGEILAKIAAANLERPK